MDISNHDLQLELLETFTAILDKKYGFKTSVKNADDFGSPYWKLYVSCPAYAGNKMGSEVNPLILDYSEDLLVKLVKGNGLFQDIEQNYMILRKHFIPKELWVEKWRS